MRCERCGTFTNPFFRYSNGNKSYTCNVCEFKGQTPQDYHQIQTFDQENFPENYNAVYDFIVPESYKLNQINQDNLLVCLDMSKESIENGSFAHVLNSIRNILEYSEEDKNIGFLLYHDIITFLEIDEENDITLHQVLDTKSPISPLSFKELFFNCNT